MVVVIAILICHCILKLPELWVEFTKRKELKYAVVHRIASYLGIMSESALSFFHTLIGCDTTSTILGKNKNRFYEHLCSKKVKYTTKILPCQNNISFWYIVQRVTQPMQTHGEEYFLKKKESISPISAALRQYILWAILQATKWYWYLEKQRIEFDNKYLLFWSELTEGFLACRFLF